MAAVAKTLNSPILLIDGLDILSETNFKLFAQFISNQILPVFEYVLITTTPHGALSNEKSEAYSKYILKDGSVTKL
jgi:hypothetical protein